MFVPPQASASAGRSRGTGNVSHGTRVPARILRRLTSSRHHRRLTGGVVFDITKGQKGLQAEKARLA
jgi:hypothetical protein